MFRTMVFIDYQNFNINLQEHYNGKQFKSINYQELAKAINKRLTLESQVIKTYLFAYKPCEQLMKVEKYSKYYEWLCKIRKTPYFEIIEGRQEIRPIHGVALDIKNDSTYTTEEKETDYEFRRNSMSEVIVVTSGKGGVGKTTTTANMGIGLAGLGKKVAMVDTDIGLRNLDVVLGLENRIVYNLVDVIESRCRLKQALIRDKRQKDLYLLPSAQTRDKSAVTPEQMCKLCEELKTQFDYVILDCPAGIEQGFQNAVAGADRAVVVTTPEVSSIRDADRIIGLLEARDLKNISLIINRIRPDMVKRGEMMSVEDVEEILAVPLLGVIPDDEYVVVATNQGEPVSGSRSPAGTAYENISRRVTGEEVPLMEITGKKHFFRRIFKK